MASTPAESSTSWPSEATSSFVDLSGEVHYLDFAGPLGAPTVVCLHGLGGSASNFGVVGPELARTARVLVVDLLGHGGSHAVLGNAASAVAANLRMVARFVDEVAGGRVVLLGHSLGGVLALLHAMDRPDQVERLVLLDPPVPTRSKRSRDPRLTARMLFLRAPGVRRIVARQIARMTPEEVVRRQLSDATPHVDRIPTAAVGAAVAEVRARRDAGDAALAQAVQWAAILDTISLLARPRDWRSRIKALELSALWLQGEDDRLVPVADATALAGIRPDWQFGTRAGVGHLPHLEDPAWTAGRITGWLGEVGRRQPPDEADGAQSGKPNT
jgi:pimeloyl-ACP methyl ester carboxylesterase